MRDVHRNLCFTANPNRFFDRTEQTNARCTLGAHVRIVHAALRRRDFRQLDHFLSFRITLRRVIQAGGHSECAFLHGARNKRFLLLELFRGRLRIALA